jgi:hypothetical protein
MLKNTHDSLNAHGTGHPDIVKLYNKHGAWLLYMKKIFKLLAQYDILVHEKVREAEE